MRTTPRKTALKRLANEEISSSPRKVRIKNTSKLKEEAVDLDVSSKSVQIDESGAIDEQRIGSSSIVPVTPSSESKSKSAPSFTPKPKPNDKSKSKSKSKSKPKPTSELTSESTSKSTSESASKSTSKSTPKSKTPKTPKAPKPPLAPLAPRTAGSKILVGAHVSGAGGVHNAVANAVRVGANAFAVFLKSQRQWAFRPLDDEARRLFVEGCAEAGYCARGDAGGDAGEGDATEAEIGGETAATAATTATTSISVSSPPIAAPPIVPHGSYLVNLAHPDPARAAQAYTSYVDDLARCHALGIQLYNIHPGSASSSPTRTAAIAQLAAQLNRAHSDRRTGRVVTLLETMAAGAGDASSHTLGGSFEELAAIMALVHDKRRVGVCVDTCHVFAAGYELRTREGFARTLAAIERTVGLAAVRALHVNDSKAPLGSGRDLHANIGTGFLGLRAFWNLVNEPRLWGVPMILETPVEPAGGGDGKAGGGGEDHVVWAREIKLLERLVGMDVESEEFVELETKLAKQGEAERARILDQVNRRKDKTPKKKSK